MNTSKIQEGIIHWLRLSKTETVSFGSIINVCANAATLDIDQSVQMKSRSNLTSQSLLPLLRIGIVEFYGANRYALSPTSAIVHNNRILLFNAPKDLVDQYEHSSIFSYLSLNLFHKSKNLEFELRKQEIPISEFDFTNLIEQIPTIEKIASSWETNLVLESNGFVYLNRYFKWTNQNPHPTQGVFKKSNDVYSQRVLKISEDSWKTIPSSKINIDSINIALCWSHLRNNGFIGSKYYEKDQALELTSSFFPILIERFLVLNTILTDPFPENTVLRKYHLSKRDFTLLNKIFENKIPCI